MGWTFYNSSGQRLSSAATNISVLDIDGATDIGAAIVDADLFIIDDGAGGTNRKTAASRVKTYIAAPSQANQAAMEAETNEDTYCPPDLIKHSPGVAKVWVQWEQAGTHSIITSYNMTSVTDGGAVGDTDHLWNVDFSGDYAMAGFGTQTGSLGVGVCVVDGGPATTGTRTLTKVWSTDDDIDTETFLICFGDQ